jgi:hypothetical protein
MAASATLSDLQTRARQRSDMVNSSFISDAELLSMINSSYAELYDLMVQTYEDYYITSSTFTLTSSDSGVEALPTDFSKLKGVDYSVGGDYISLYPYNWNTRNDRQYNRRVRTDYNRTYKILGSNLRIEPRDNATGDYQLWYIPSFTPLVSTTDIVDSQMTRNGWEEYIVVDVAIKMLAKEESNTAHLVAEKKALKQRLAAAAGDRDADQPEYVSDVNRQPDGYWDY